MVGPTDLNLRPLHPSEVRYQTAPRPDYLRFAVNRLAITASRLYTGKNNLVTNIHAHISFIRILESKCAPKRYRFGAIPISADNWRVHAIRIIGPAI